MNKAEKYFNEHPNKDYTLDACWTEEARAKVIIEMLTDFAEKYPNKEAMRKAFAAGCDFVHYMNTSRTSIDFNEWYNQKHQEDERL